MCPAHSTKHDFFLLIEAQPFPPRSIFPRLPFSKELSFAILLWLCFVILCLLFGRWRRDSAKILPHGGKQDVFDKRLVARMRKSRFAGSCRRQTSVTQAMRWRRATETVRICFGPRNSTSPFWRALRQPGLARNDLRSRKRVGERYWPSLVPMACPLVICLLWPRLWSKLYIFCMCI